MGSTALNPVQDMDLAPPPSSAQQGNQNSHTCSIFFTKIRELRLKTSTKNNPKFSKCFQGDSSVSLKISSVLFFNLLKIHDFLKKNITGCLEYFECATKLSRNYTQLLKITKTHNCIHSCFSETLPKETLC